MAVAKFFEFAGRLVDKDKLKLFKAVFRYPVKTNELTGEIFEVFSKVFDGRDPIKRFEFTSEEHEQDFQAYLDSIGEPEKWRTLALNSMKCAINSIWVVDLPQEQKGIFPEPYYFLLRIDQIIDYGYDKDGNFEFVQFKPNPKTIAFFDKKYYRTFESETDEIKKGSTPLIEVVHNLGECPAGFFWSDSIDLEEKGVKKSPITHELSDLDWFLFFSLSKRVLDTYAAYPIYWGFSQDCNYTSLNEECVDGYMHNLETGESILEGSYLKPCPVCTNNRLAGAGSYYEVDPPGPANENANLRDPIGIVTIDKTSLDYNAEEVKRLRNEIFRSCTGFSGDLINDQAVNEMQIGGFFESGENVIKSLARNLEKAEKKILETIAKLRYAERFVSISISYGTKYNLVSADHLLKMYQEARDEDLDIEVLDRLQDEYFDTKYKNNPIELQRAKIIVNIDPFRHKTGEQIQRLFEAGVIDRKDFLVKYNLSTYLKRFERENISLIRFGELIDFKEKIDRIKETLYSYIPEAEFTSNPEE